MSKSNQGGKFKLPKSIRKIKPSQALGTASGILGIGSAGATISGVGAPVAPFLAAGSGVSAGLSKILANMGAGLSKAQINKIQRMKRKHDKIAMGGKFVPMDPKELRFLNNLLKGKTGGQLRSGGQLRTGGSVSKKIQTTGSKRQVWNGSAIKTSGGLTKDKLMMNKRGKIVSRKKHEIGLKRFKENKLKPKSAEELAELRKRRRK